MTGHRLPKRPLFAAITILAGGLLLCAGGCRSHSEIGGGSEYPDMQQARVVDVQVIREDTDIRFTNTSAQSFPACRMWVNRWWSIELEPLGVGETRQLDLRDFKDAYGEPFRAGGFFATEAPDKLVAAQLEVGGEMVGLIVIGQ